MNTNASPKVDRTVAFTTSAFIPSGTPAADAMFDAVASVIRDARVAGRQPVMIEVTVRVAP